MTKASGVTEAAPGVGFGVALGVRRQRLSWWGRAGLVLFGVHTLLLFFPPIPRDVKGPLWSYLAGYIAVFLLLVELIRLRGTVVARWAAAAPERRRALGLGAAIGTLALGLTLRAYAAPLFYVLSGEYGLMEPVSLLCYLGSAVILFGASREMEGSERKHWQFIAALYGLLGLEEIDYFGIFGNLIGRVQGVYSGSLHDLIRMASEGVLQLGVAAALGAIFLAVAAGLWRAGYLQPRALVSLLRSRDFFWVVLGLAFLWTAAAEEAHLFGWVAAHPTPEEAIELSGSICLTVYALQRAARHLRSS